MRSAEAYITVMCDVCEHEEQISLTGTAHGYDERKVDDDLEAMGWWVKDGKDICAGCLESMQDDT